MTGFSVLRRRCVSPFLGAFRCRVGSFERFGSLGRDCGRLGRTLGRGRGFGAFGSGRGIAFGVIRSDVVALLVVGVLAVELAVLRCDLAAFGGLFDRQRDAAAF